MTSKDILRALRYPIEEFTNAITAELVKRAGAQGSIYPSVHDRQTLMIAFYSSSHGIIGIEFTSPPLLPAISIMVNRELYEAVHEKYRAVFSYSQKSFSRDREVIILKLGAYDVDRYSDASPYYPSESTKARSEALVKYNTEPKVKRKLRFSGQWEHSKFADRWR